MRILLDECVPVKLRRALSGHSVRTVTEMGWSSKKNGELLASMMSDGFEVLLTVDKNLRFQQNLAKFGIAVVVIRGLSNRTADLLPLMPSVLAALASLKPGDAVEVSS